MKKRLLLLASAVLFSVAAHAQGIYADANAVSVVKDGTALEAGAVIGQNDAITLSIAAPDTYKPGSAQVNPFTTYVINGEEFSASKGITGSNNPKDADGTSPDKSLKQPATGAAFQVDAKQDGYLIAWAKLTANKAYTVFEDGVAIGYHAVLYVDAETKLDVTLQGEGDNNQVTSKIGNIASLAGSSSTASGMGIIVFPVAAGKSYILNAAGSKISLGGVYFSADSDNSVKIKGSSDEVTLIASVQDYTVSPVANKKGVVSEGISPIVLTFPYATKVEDNPAADYWTQFPLLEYNSPRAGWGEIPAEPTIEGNAISFALEQGDQIEGEFRLTIPAGTYLLDGKQNKDIEVTLIYGSLLAYTTTPAEGDSTKEISPIVVTFQNAEKVEENPNADYWTQYAVVEYNSPRAGWGEIPAEITLKDNTVSFALENQDQIGGDFRVTIPAGTYLVDGLENTQIVLTFTSTISVQDYTVAPEADENGKVHTNPIVLTFPHASKVAWADSLTALPTLTYALSEKLPTWNATIQTKIAGNQVSFAINPTDLKATQYTLTIPAGTFLLDGEANEEIVETFDYDLTVPEYSVAVTPADSVAFASIDVVGITVTSDAAVTFNTNATFYVGEQATTASVSGNSLVLTLDEPIVEAGEYKVVVPGNTILLGGIPVQESKIYTVQVDPEQGAKLQTYTVTPEALNTKNLVDSISPIVLTFPTATSVVDNPNADYWTQYAVVEYNSPRAGWGEIPAEITLKDNTISFALEQGDQIEGEFRVTIPAGTYLLNGFAENEEIVLNFLLGDLQSVVVTPEENFKGQVNDISPIVVTYTNAVEVVDNPNADYWTQYAVVEYNSPLAGWGEIPAEITIEGNVISFVLDKQDQINGDFRLTIPAGTYLIDGVENAELIDTLSYLDIQAYEVAPVANSKGVIALISPIVLTFTNAEEVVDNPEADYWTQYAQVEYESPLAGWGEIPAEPVIEGNVITFTLDKQDQIQGNFRLTIPAGTYLLDSIENKEIVAEFTVGNVLPYSVSPIVNDTTATLNPIVITYVKADKVEENPAADYWTQYAQVTYTSAKAGEVEAEIEVTLTDNRITINVSEQDLQSTGDFTLTIPAGTYLVDGVENEEIVVSFTYDPTYTAIEGILNDVRKAGIIYNLQGVRVDAKAVTPGVYVIDGKKVMLR